MPDETENLTLHMLREMREESRRFRRDVLDRFEKVETTIAEGFNTVNDRLESVFAGLSFLHADERGEIEALKARLEQIENQLGLSGEPAE